jgi:hypothetical protein
VREEMLVLALPPVKVTGEPALAPSIRNWMLPAAAFGETTAVKVTDWPYTEEVAAEVRVVVVDA